MQNFSMKTIVMTGLIAAAMGLGGGAVAADSGKRSVAPKDPAGTQTGQAQRDPVTSAAPGGGPNPDAGQFENPAGTQSGSRPPGTGFATGEAPNPDADQFKNPAGTQSGP